MMRRIVEQSLKLRFLVVVIGAAILFFGIVQLRTMPVDVLPEFGPPLVEVQTEALGLSAAEVEDLVTVPMEELLNGLPWLQTMRSESISGLSSIVLVFDQGTDIMRARAWLRPIARWAAAREARALRRLDPLEGFARVRHWDGKVLVRSYIEGAPMQEAQPRHVGFYRAAWRLLRDMHRRGVSHNDLAKEPNWLVTPAGDPALTDFQLAQFGPPRSQRMRLLAREDLRHLLKHKRTYCPDQLTPIERPA